MDLNLLGPFILSIRYSLTGRSDLDRELYLNSVHTSFKMSSLKAISNTVRLLILIYTFSIYLRLLKFRLSEA